MGDKYAVDKPKEKQVYIETGRTDVDTENNADYWSNRVVCLNSATAAEEFKYSQIKMSV